MNYLSSLPEDARLSIVLRANPEMARPLLQVHDALLRGPSQLTVPERELLAAYVSGLNACHYSHGIHASAAEAFGVPEGKLVSLLDDLDTAEITERMRVLLRYLRKLTLSPAARCPPMPKRSSRPARTTRRYPTPSQCAPCSTSPLRRRIGIATRTEYTTTSADRIADIGYADLLELLEDGPATSGASQNDSGALNTL